MISREDYLRNVQTDNSAHHFFEYLYTNENQYKIEKKEIVYKSIDNYLIKLTNIPIDIDDLINYYSSNRNVMNSNFIRNLQAKFYVTQMDKKYMCFHNNNFYIDEIMPEELRITENNFRLKRGRNNLYNTLVFINDYAEIHMLLRWKNHAGILYPAWQIKLFRKN